MLNKCQANSDLFSHAHIALFYLQVLLRHTNRWLDLESFALSRKIRFCPDGGTSFSANIIPLPYGQKNLWQWKLCSTSYFNTDNVWLLVHIHWFLSLGNQGIGNPINKSTKNSNFKSPCKFIISKWHISTLYFFKFIKLETCKTIQSTCIKLNREF